MPVLGVDVSHHQGAVDWSAVSRTNVRFAYCKATEGATMVDTAFAANWGALERTTLLRGAYHFARPSLSSPERQALHFAEVVGDLTLPRVLPPALDLETDGGLPAMQVLNWTRAFVSAAEQLLKRELVIYTGRLWREVLGDPLVPELGTRMLWTARYGTQEPKPMRTWGRWDFWQFTDGAAGEVQSINGIKGPVDCDRWRGTFEELEALAGGRPKDG